MTKARTYSADQFELDEELGRGAFGVVYRGFDKVSQQHVAIKQVDLESSDEIQEIQQEIKILSTCNNKNVARYHGCFLKGYKLWIIMELLGGGSCSDLLTAGPFSEDVIALIMHELLHALVYLHENGKIHRDFKAANVLVSNTGDVKIADFGVATQLSNNMSKRNTFVGTPYWMPPEIIMHKAYDFAADIWSLGITALELAYGKPPLSQFHPFDVLFKIVDDPPPRLGSGFSKPFDDFVQQCLQKDPKLRPKASSLLSHPFVIRGSKVSKNDLVRLIDKKIQWDIETGNNNKRFYIPTVQAHIAKKESPGNFDLGTLTLGPTIPALEDNDTLKQSVVPSSPIPKEEQVNPDYNTSDSDLKLRRCLNRILNQSFNKIAEKYNLSTSQYDNLVNFQTTLMESFLVSQEEQYKEMFSKFVKLVLKKVMKSDYRELKEIILPGYYAEMEASLAKYKAREKEEAAKPRDDVEELLLTRWAEGILEKI